jgi:hypothetical protein
MLSVSVSCDCDLFFLLHDAMELSLWKLVFQNFGSCIFTPVLCTLNIWNVELCKSFQHWTTADDKRVWIYYDVIIADCLWITESWEGTGHKLSRSKTDFNLDQTRVLWCVQMNVQTDCIFKWSVWSKHSRALDKKWGKTLLLVMNTWWSAIQLSILRIHLRLLHLWHFGIYLQKKMISYSGLSCSVFWHYYSCNDILGTAHIKSGTGQSRE